MASDECIISAALSGVAADRRQCPAIPYTPAEYAVEARRAVDAGAAMVHLHARTPDGAPSYAVEDYRAIRDAIVAEVPEVITNFSTGAVGIPPAERIAHISQVVPEVAALNMGSLNYAKFSSSRREFVFDFCFENRYETIMFFLERMRDAGVRPECECFDTGHVAGSAPLFELGLLTAPVSFSMVVGVLGGAPARADTLAHMSTLVPDGCSWQVVGIGRQQWEMVDAAIDLGGNVRVGLEDNFYLPSGEMATSNGDLVAAAAARIEAAGRSVVSPGRARELLGLPVPAAR